MTNVVDMDKVVDGDNTTLKGTGINQSEVYLESNNQKKKGIFYKIFNLFD